MNDRTRNRSLLTRLVQVAGVAGFLMLAMPWFSASAEAQNVCGPRADVLELLHDRFAEAPVAIGLAADGSVVEVLSAKDGATWTLVVTTPNGNSCAIAAGESWTEVIAVAGEPA